MAKYQVILPTSVGSYFRGAEGAEGEDGFEKWCDLEEEVSRAIRMIQILIESKCEYRTRKRNGEIVVAFTHESFTSKKVLWHWMKCQFENLNEGDYTVVDVSAL